MAGYFPGEVPALAARIDTYLGGLANRLSAENFAPAIDALLLAGGYGRGEGGVFIAAPGATPALYNDLEFYLLLRDPAAEPDAHIWCEREEREGTAALGIDVEFKRLATAALTGAEPSMFYYDLVVGHRLVWGDAGVLARLPDRLRDPRLIPAHEATRLLFNRGSGLFFCRSALATPADRRVTDGFIERNHAKVRLALADTVLAYNGRYHASCRVRAERLAEPLPALPPAWDRLRAWHAEGVEFKLHPRHRQPGRPELEAAQHELASAWRDLFLWLEGRRLGREFPDAKAYADAPGRFFSHTPVWRNLLLRLRDRRTRHGALPMWTDYPRGALQRALILLTDPASGPVEWARVARWIGCAPVSEISRLEQSYLHWWRFYN